MEAGWMNVLITGTNRGLGLEMVRQMVEGSIPVRKLIACCRDPDGPGAEVSPELLLLSDGSQHLQCCSLYPLGHPEPGDLFFKAFFFVFRRLCKHWESSILISSPSSLWVRVKCCYIYSPPHPTTLTLRRRQCDYV